MPHLFIENVNSAAYTYTGQRMSIHYNMLLIHQLHAAYTTSTTVHATVSIGCLSTSITYGLYEHSRSYDVHILEY
jgi:hypothetical protein